MTIEIVTRKSSNTRNIPIFFKNISTIGLISLCLLVTGCFKNDEEKANELYVALMSDINATSNGVLLTNLDSMYAFSKTVISVTNTIIKDYPSTKIAVDIMSGNVRFRTYSHQQLSQNYTLLDQLSLVNMPLNIFKEKIASSLAEASISSDAIFWSVFIDGLQKKEASKGAEYIEAFKALVSIDDFYSNAFIDSFIKRSLPELAIKYPDLNKADLPHLREQVCSKYENSVCENHLKSGETNHYKTLIANSDVDGIESALVESQYAYYQLNLFVDAMKFLPTAEGESIRQRLLELYLTGLKSSINEHEIDFLKENAERRLIYRRIIALNKLGFKDEADRQLHAIVFENIEDVEAIETFVEELISLGYIEFVETAAKKGMELLPGEDNFEYNINELLKIMLAIDNMEGIHMLSIIATSLPSDEEYIKFVYEDYFYIELANLLFANDHVYLAQKMIDELVPSEFKLENEFSTFYVPLYLASMERFELIYTIFESSDFTIKEVDSVEHAQISASAFLIELYASQEMTTKQTLYYIDYLANVGLIDYNLLVLTPN